MLGAQFAKQNKCRRKVLQMFLSKYFVQQNDTILVLYFIIFLNK